MNVVLNLKESRSQSMLEILGKAAATGDIVINTKHEESQEKDSGPTLSTGEWLEKQDREREVEQKEAGEQETGRATTKNFEKSAKSH